MPTVQAGRAGNEALYVPPSAGAATRTCTIPQLMSNPSWVVPGAVIDIVPGSYSGNVTISGSGSPGNPCVIRGFGVTMNAGGRTAVLHDEGVFKITGNDVVLQGFTFTSTSGTSMVTIRGYRNRVSQCEFNGCGNGSGGAVINDSIVNVFGSGDRGVVVDNNTFTQVRNVAFSMVDDCGGVVFTHNTINGPKQFSGGETMAIKMGTISAGPSSTTPKSWIQFNTINNWDDGYPYVASTKIANVTWAYNRIDGSTKQILESRNAYRTRWIGNYIVNGALVLMGAEHLVQHNVLRIGTGDGYYGGGPLVVYATQDVSGIPAFYLAMTGATITQNRIIRATASGFGTVNIQNGGNNALNSTITGNTISNNTVVGGTPSYEQFSTFGSNTVSGNTITPYSSGLDPQPPSVEYVSSEVRLLTGGGGYSLSGLVSIGVAITGSPSVASIIPASGAVGVQFGVAGSPSSTHVLSLSGVVGVEFAAAGQPGLNGSAVFDLDGNIGIQFSLAGTPSLTGSSVYEIDGAVGITFTASGQPLGVSTKNLGGAVSLTWSTSGSPSSLAVGSFAGAVGIEFGVAGEATKSRVASGPVLFDGHFRTYLDVRHLVESQLGPLDSDGHFAFMTCLGNALASAWAELKDFPYFYEEWTLEGTDGVFSLPGDVASICSPALHLEGCRSTSAACSGDPDPCTISVRSGKITCPSADDTLTVKGQRRPRDEFFVVNEATKCVDWQDIDLPTWARSPYAKAVLGMTMFACGHPQGIDWITLAAGELRESLVANRLRPVDPIIVGSATKAGCGCAVRIAWGDYRFGVVG